MIKIENTKVEGFEPAIRGMRNPLNSWDRSDSASDNSGFKLGKADGDLAKRLNNGGPVHAKYRRMVVVWCDITAPLYWWKEFDTYKVGTVANSCSTMHKLTEKEFKLSDFSTEHLLSLDDILPNNDVTSLILNANPLIETDEGSYWSPLGVFKLQITMLNKCRKLYLQTKDKTYWWQLIQLLPSSYNQKRTVMLSYEVLSNIYTWRKDHKLDEWYDFCDWIAKLPYSNLVTG